MQEDQELYLPFPKRNGTLRKVKRQIILRLFRQGVVLEESEGVQPHVETKNVRVKPVKNKLYI